MIFSKVDDYLNEFFKNEEIEKILNRWLLASLIKSRKEILRTSVEHILNGDYISPIFILIPQIEGLIVDHIKRSRKRPKSTIPERINQFGKIIINEVYNTKWTRYLTRILISHLKKTFYKRRSYLSPQRHVLAHGEVNPKFFSRINCIKLILVIDAIILLSLRKRELRVHNN